MLPAANRLRRGAEFRAVFGNGFRVGGPRIVVTTSLAQAHTSADVRVGFSVGRSVGNAVGRNAVRRKLRHLMRERLTELPSGSCVVVRALPAAAGASSTLLARDLDRALARGREKAGAGA